MRSIMPVKEPILFEFIFACALYLGIACYGAVISVILQILIFQVSNSFEAFLLTLMLWIGLFMGLGLLTRSTRAPEDILSKLFVLCVLISACVGAMVNGVNLYNDFFPLFRTPTDLREYGYSNGGIVMLVETALLSAFIGLAVLSGGTLLRRSQEKRKVEDL